MVKYLTPCVKCCRYICYMIVFNFNLYLVQGVYSTYTHTDVKFIATVSQFIQAIARNVSQVDEFSQRNKLSYVNLILNQIDDVALYGLYDTLPGINFDFIDENIRLYCQRVDTNDGFTFEDNFTSVIINNDFISRKINASITKYSDVSIFEISNNIYEYLSSNENNDNIHGISNITSISVISEIDNVSLSDIHYNTEYTRETSCDGSTVEFIISYNYDSNIGDINSSRYNFTGCFYINMNDGSFEKDGCFMSDFGDNWVECTCYHLTSFFIAFTDESCTDCLTNSGYGLNYSKQYFDAPSTWIIFNIFYTIVLLFACWQLYFIVRSLRVHYFRIVCVVCLVCKCFPFLFFVFVVLCCMHTKHLKGLYKKHDACTMHMTHTCMIGKNKNEHG